MGSWEGPKIPPQVVFSKKFKDNEENEKRRPNIEATVIMTSDNPMNIKLTNAVINAKGDNWPCGNGKGLWRLNWSEFYSTSK